MCSMRSMRCAYYRWQLVFANIINKNRYSIMYHKLTAFSCYIHTHTMIDTWMHTLFYYRLSSSQFIYVLNANVFIMYRLLLYYIIPLPSVYTLAESLLPWICMSRSGYILFCWSGIWGGPHALRGAQSSLCLITWWHIFMFSLILVDFIDSLYYLDSTLFYLIVHRIMISCVWNLCHITVIIFIIVELYRLLWDIMYM